MQETKKEHKDTCIRCMYYRGSVEGLEDACFCGRIGKIVSDGDACYDFFSFSEACDIIEEYKKNGNVGGVTYF